MVNKELNIVSVRNEKWNKGLTSPKDEKIHTATKV